MPLATGANLRADSIQARDAAEQAVTERQPISAMVMIEKLVLELRHIDVGRTFGFARLAFQTEIHDFMQPFSGEIFFRHFAGEHGSQSIGSAARGMLFIQGAHVRRTHGAFKFLSALAHAAAHLDGSHEAALRAKIQCRLRLSRFCTADGS